MFTALAAAALTITGIMVGIEFCVAIVVPGIHRRLPVGEFLDVQADSARLMGRMMPFWYFGSLILTLGMAVACWGTVAAGLAMISVALLALSVIMSVTLLVPTNNRSAGWTREEHPADWREQLERWNSLHIVRLAVIVAAFVLATLVPSLL